MKQFKLILDNQDNTFVQNFIMRDEKVLKVPGTDRYNETVLASSIPWTERYYGLKPDGTHTKKVFCYSGTSIYMGNDAASTLTATHTGLTANTYPISVTIQQAQTSRMYFFNGYDTPIYYEGNDGGTFTDSSITYKFQGGCVKDNRLWGFERNNSKMWYSSSTDSEDIDTNGGFVTVGNEKDSFIRNSVAIGGFIYVFKNDSVWIIRGSSASTYRADVVLPEVGLLAQNALAVVNRAILFATQQDRQIASFDGTQARYLTGELFNFDFSSEIDPSQNKTDGMCAVWDRKNNLFRMSYKGVTADENYNNYEAILPTDDIGADSKPKWTTTYGARIASYSMWDREGDYVLVSGRSDTGRLMYHNRGFNWDNEPMVVRLRTDNVVPKDGYNTKFNSVFIKGTPSEGTVTLRTYLNERLTYVGTIESVSVDDTGETETLESLSYKTQAKFNYYIPLLTGYNFGESMAFEIYDNTLDKQIELDWLVVDYTTRAPVRNKLVG